MSYTYLQGQEEVSSEEYCWDTDPCALLKSIHIAGEFFCSGNETESCQDSQFGTTSKPLTEQNGAEGSTSYAGDFPVRTLALQEKGKVSMESDPDCGLKWRELFVKFDLDTHSWRTRQCLFDEVLQPCSVILPKWGMMQSGVCSELMTSVRPTAEKESGYWATPTTMDKLPPKSEAALLREATIARPGRSKPANLRDQVSNAHLWPTPTVNGNHNRKGVSKTSQDGLSTAVKKERLPTPTSSMVTAQDFEQAKYNSKTRPEYSKIQNGGALNPDWVEWLMGWPIGWTDLKPLAMDKFLLWLHKHGAISLRAQGGQCECQGK